MSEEQQETVVQSEPMVQSPNTMTRAQFENELKTNQNLSPEDIAAAFFQLEYPRYKSLISQLSRNELERLALNLAGGELVPMQNQLKSEKEKSAYYLGSQMSQNRVIMQLSVEMEKAEKAQAALEEVNNKEETNNNNTQGENTNV